MCPHPFVPHPCEPLSRRVSCLCTALHLPHECCLWRRHKALAGTHPEPRVSQRHKPGLEGGTVVPGPLSGLEPEQCPPKWHSQSTPGMEQKLGSLGREGITGEQHLFINNRTPGLFAQATADLYCPYPSNLDIPNYSFLQRAHYKTHCIPTFPAPFPTINTSREDGNHPAARVQDPDAKQALNPGSCPHQDVSHRCHWHRGKTKCSGAQSFPRPRSACTQGTQTGTGSVQQLPLTSGSLCAQAGRVSTWKEAEGGSCFGSGGMLWAADPQRSPRLSFAPVQRSGLRTRMEVWQQGSCPSWNQPCLQEGRGNRGAGSAREAGPPLPAPDGHGGDVSTHRWGEEHGQGAQPSPKNPSKPPLLCSLCPCLPVPSPCCSCSSLE